LIVRSLEACVADEQDPLMELDILWRREAIRQALFLREEIARFQASWPELDMPATPMPSFTWEQLERQLRDLAGAPVKAGMAESVVSATRKQARFKPPEMVLREILLLASTLLDDGFQPGSEENPMT
jgi:hypothetical protein